jgi:hypothetical protein
MILVGLFAGIHYQDNISYHDKLSSKADLINFHGKMTCHEQNNTVIPGWTNHSQQIVLIYFDGKTTCQVPGQLDLPR